MTKLYLSKSNLASSYVVKQVRDALAARYDVQVIEFTGGKYSNKPLLDSDMLLCIGPVDTANKLPTKLAKCERNMGMGQFKQVEDFCDEYDYDNIVMIDHITTDNRIVVKQIIDHNYEFRLSTEDVYSNYGYVKLTDVPSELNYWVDEKSKVASIAEPKKPSTKTMDDFLRELKKPESAPVESPKQSGLYTRLSDIKKQQDEEAKIMKREYDSIDGYKTIDGRWEVKTMPISAPVWMGEGTNVLNTKDKTVKEYFDSLLGKPISTFSKKAKPILATALL